MKVAHLCGIGVAASLLVGMAACRAPTGSTSSALGGTYIPTDEAGPMTAGLDDHDYDVVVKSISDELKGRGLRDGYVVALGPVDSSGSTETVRADIIQRSLEAVFNQQGRLKFQTLAESIRSAGTPQQEIMNIKGFNWATLEVEDKEEFFKLGQIVQADGILVGSVTLQQAAVPGTRETEVRYRFAWRLINTKTGLLDMAYETKLGKRVRR